MESRITIKKIIVQCYGIIFNLIFSIIAITICNLYFVELTTEMYIFFGTFVFVPIILTIIILFSYFLVNYRVIFKENEREYGIIKNNNARYFSPDDIEYHQKVMTYPYAEERNTWLPWDDLHYSVIKLKSGEKICITSILITDFNIPLDSARFRVKKTFFPIVFLD